MEQWKDTRWLDKKENCFYIQTKSKGCGVQKVELMEHASLEIGNK